ncbi:hypothetical protein FDA94_26610 [Herbidospora galbida]|uniref:Uncharacterized protein n=1 Tax=Herbidospora galbida TaxID=2575442 RepID=A0A4U3MAW2_9ACTN|nr:hypothetical protein [Herbidospora galbida]TKK85244.1 hypothetical protein FDA94_26610 [Herbidospora galbida]
MDRIGTMLSGLGAPPPGANLGHRSVVYIQMPDYGMAAVIERLYKPNASPLRDMRGHAGGYTDRAPYGGREQQVARALVGPAAEVTWELALACHDRGLTDIPGLGLEAGDVDYDDRLNPLHAETLRDFTKTWLRHVDDRRSGPNLDRLIAAALRNPAQPISALLPPERLSGDGALQSAYLLGLWGTVSFLLLSGMKSGWRGSFSTFEPPPGNTIHNLPHLVFRDFTRSAHGDAPPTQTRDENTVHLYAGAPPAPDDECLRLGSMLARAYEELGYNKLVPLLKQVAAYRTMPERFHMLMTMPDLARFDDGKTVLAPLPAAPRSPAEGRRHHHEPDAAPEDARSSNGAELVQVYEMLQSRAGTPAFLELVEWIHAAAAQGVTVGHQQAERLVAVLEDVGWYERELKTAYRAGAAARLAGLLYPLFAGRLNDRRTLSWMSDKVTRPETSPNLVRALIFLYSRADGASAGLMAEFVAPSLVRRAAAMSGSLTEAPFWKRTFTAPGWMLAAVVVLVTISVVLQLAW